MPLTKPAVSPRNAENKERELINEFLRLFFTGSAHNDDDGHPVTFPLCAVEFNQTDVHTLEIPLIHWNFVTRVSTQQPGENGTNVKTDSVNNVYVQVAGAGNNNASDHLCAEVASHLKELLGSSQKVLLAAKGIQHCRVMRGPTPMNLPGLRTRLLVVKTRIEYEIPSH